MKKILLFMYLILNLVCMGNVEQPIFYYEKNQILEGVFDIGKAFDPDGKEVKPYFLYLNEKIQVLPLSNKDYDFEEPIRNVSKIQLAMDSKLINYLKTKNAYKKKVKVMGELYFRHTGHHYTDVLMSVDKVELLEESSTIKTKKNTEITFKNYKNSLYNFSIDYPSNNFTIFDNSRELFSLYYNKAPIAIYISGRENLSYSSLEEEYNYQVRLHKPTLGYNVLKKNFYVVTYVNGKNLIYEKTMYDPKRNNYATLFAEFPKEYKEFMSPILEKMVWSMKFN